MSAITAKARRKMKKYAVLTREPRCFLGSFDFSWEQRKLGEVIRLNGRIGFRGYTEKDIVSKDDGGVLTFSPTNIVDNKLTTNCKNTYITRFKYDESPEIKIHNGDILFVKTGSTLGKSALVTGLSEDATLNPQVVVMRTNNLNAEFLAAMLVTNAIISQVNSAKIGGAVPTLTETRIKDFDVAIPVSEAEKEQIGQFFSQLDHLITLHQRKFEKLTNVKKSMLEKMFPQNGSSYPEIRFKGFTDPWEQRKLGELVDRVVRKNTNNESTLPLTISAQYGLVDQITYFNNRVASRDVSNYYLVLNGEFAYNKSTSDGYPFGAVKRLDLYEKGVLSTLYIVFAPKKEQQIDSDYLTVFFDTDRWHKGVAERAAEGARNHGLLNISAEDFFDIDLSVPKDIVEQKQIGAFIRQLDNLITLHQRKGKQPSPAAPMMQIIQKVFIVKHGISDINVKKSQISTDSMLNCSVHLLRIG